MVTVPPDWATVVSFAVAVKVNVPPVAIFEAVEPSVAIKAVPVRAEVGILEKVLLDPLIVLLVKVAAKSLKVKVSLPVSSGKLTVLSAVRLATPKIYC